MQKKIFKIALCQIKTVRDKSENIQKAVKMIKEASSNGADLIMLPEMFNSPFNKKFMLEYKEPILDDYKTNPKCHTTKILSELAKETSKYIIGGSIPELIEGEDRIYNTCLCFNREGEIVAKHRKLHLYDINIPGKIVNKESDFVKHGPPAVTIFETEYCKIGIGICYDIRFPEYAQLLKEKGAEIICYPANFSLKTGEMHFDILRQGRAVDNLSYLITCGSASNVEDTEVFQSWGASGVVSPWGHFIAKAGQEETIVYANIDLQEVANIREQILVGQHKRGDVYELNGKI